ncbi:glycoside hydrolase domain-containing protein [Corynebacterium sp. S7]
MTNVNNSTYSRRGVLKAASIAVAAGVVGTSVAPAARAQNSIIGTVIDYSAGVPSGSAVAAAGHLGAVRYVSQPRPDAAWMAGKPVRLAETQDFAANGLSTASVYQFGRETTADWLQGAAGAATHAPQAIALHRAAGGPTGRPIYVAIDDNPTQTQYTNQIRPYLQAFQAALTAAGYQTGIYGNWNTIEWAIQDGIGSFFWQHDWGSNGKIHPRVTIHQKAGWQTRVDGVEVDINNVYAEDWGQWKPGQTTQTPSNQPGQSGATQDSTGQSTTYSIPLPDKAQLDQIGAQASNLSSNINQQDLQTALEAARKFIQ